jgi:hypothetical protein
MLTPCGMCMVYQRLSCTSRAQTWAQAHTQAPPPANWHYAQVVKRRKGGRVVEVTTKIIFGSEAAVQAR